MTLHYIKEYFTSQKLNGMKSYHNLKKQTFELLFWLSRPPCLCWEALIERAEVAKVRKVEV